MARTRRIAGTLASALAVGVIGWVDFATGADVGLSLLYLIPIAASGWFAGVIPAVVVSLCGAAAWLYADLAVRSTDALVAVSLWNGFTRLVIYLTQGVMVAMLHRDREKLKRYGARQANLARTDHTTSLPNARSFHEAVEDEVSRAGKGDCVCVLFLDLDDFKTVNDRYGHDAGDQVLQRTAAILLRSIRGQDIAARLGGDEFGVLLIGIEADAALAVGERIIRRIAAVGEDYPNATLGATAGVVCCATPQQSVAAIIRAADAAMYEGKSRGKGVVTVRRLSSSEEIA